MVDRDRIGGPVRMALRVAEARLTHRHPLSGDVAAAVVRLCRALIRGLPWSEALGVAADGRMVETRRALGMLSSEGLSRDGYAPDVLAAAVHFVGTSESGPTALARSIAFAGSANYCPVVVGSIGGARWGRDQIEEEPVHHHGGLVARVTAVAGALAAGWRGVGTGESDEKRLMAGSVTSRSVAGVGEASISAAAPVKPAAP